MDRIALLPPAFLRARLELIDKELERLSLLSVSTHRGRDVIKEYYYDNGVKKAREHLVRDDKGKLLLACLEKRTMLLESKRQLEGYITHKTAYQGIDLTKVKTPLNRDFWERHQDEMLEPDSNVYYVNNGIRMRSRGEVVIAQVLDSLGLKYKYEIKMGIDGDWYYPDFTVFLPEFERCFLIEFLGMVDDRNYAVKNGMKIGLYMNAGLVVNEDVLIFAGTRNSMPDVETIIGDIAAMLNKFCRMYAK